MPRQRRSGQEADVWRVSLGGQRAEERVDGIIAEIDALFGALPDGPLTEGDRLRIMREVDELLVREFGTSRLTADQSAFYRLYLNNLDAAAHAPALRAIADLERLVGPERWPAVQAALLTGTIRFARIYQATRGPVAQGVRLRNLGLFDPQRAWVTGSRLRLSDRVWLRGRIVRRGIDREIRAAIRNGTGAKAAARDVRKYLNSGHAKGSAERLMRTEIQRVHAESTRAVAEVTPGVRGLRWVLSLAHPVRDHCDVNAEGHSPGMGRGEYTFEEFPVMPDHPRCMCHTQHVFSSREELFNELEQLYREGLAA